MLGSPPCLGSTFDPLAKQDGEYRQAIGVALEAKRRDKLRQAITESGDAQTMLQYTFRICMEHVPIAFRQEV